MTVNGQDETLQLNAIRNDPRILLKALGYAHGDESRRWYFVMDFEVNYEDMNGVAKPLPRAVYPGTQIAVLPTGEGIRSILREASAEGSGFVHFGGHCMLATAGTSGIMDEPDEKIRYTQTQTLNGSPIKEAFIVTTDGGRLYGREFIESLGDGTDKRCGTTLTLSLDMCNASAFLAGIVDMPYQYRGEGVQEPVPTTRSTNQLVVISASQRGQLAGTFSDCGAMTYFLTTALISEVHRRQGLSAADVIRYIHDRCQSQPDERLLQTPQITSRYQLTGGFWLLPTRYPML
ncbi:hypothetical protein FRC04_001437 [Tulasnella sp. 424]|nr:hypothetical protein FRC04_001437 [Tulasnella sp. 424]